VKLKFVATPLTPDQVTDLVRIPAP
jgi:hypothetical protein